MGEMQSRVERLERQLAIGNISSPEDSERRLARLEAIVNRLLADPTIGAALSSYPTFSGKVGKLTENGIEFIDDSFALQKGQLTGAIDYQSTTLSLIAETMRAFLTSKFWDEYAEIRARSSDAGGATDTVVTVTISTAGVGATPAAVVSFTFRRSGFLVVENGGIALLDGIAEPDTLAGFTQIYVDSTDGDLKAKFGDGFVGIIRADS